jgi:potassium efflux system protein
VQYTVFPLLGLVFSEMTLRGSEQLRPVFWLLLFYRIIAGIMQAVISERRARIYTRRFLAPLLVVVVTGVIGTNLSGVFGLGDLELFQILGATITLGNLVNAVVVFFFFFAVAWIARDILAILAKRNTKYEPGAVHAVAMIGYYSIVAIGALTSLAILGFNLATLAIIGGGLSVDLGFGMQELVSNFISGILLLFEQSLRLGDVISVGGKNGTVDQLHMRATVLRTLDNEEIFVPNTDFLTSTVETFTHSDRTVRRVVGVGASYDSDPLQIRAWFKMG